MSRAKLSLVEILTVSIVLISLVIGLYLGFTDAKKYEAFVVEDGIVEWLTVTGLVLAALTCFSRAVRLRKEKSTVFVIVALLMGAVLIFGAGEEISWGQRIFGLKSPEYFMEHNSQQETNLHNLVLGSVRINLWIFSFLLSAILLVYVVIIPLLYRRKDWMRRLIDYWGVPLSKVYQIIFLLVLFAATQPIPNGKRAELAELVTASTLFLIIAYPANKRTFEKRLP